MTGMLILTKVALENMETKDVVILAVALIGSGSLLVNVVTWFLNRKRYRVGVEKERVETSQIIVGMYDKLLDDLRVTVNSLQSEVTLLKAKETAYLENQNKWMDQNRELNKRIKQLEKLNDEQEVKIKQQHEEIEKLKKALADKTK